MRYEVAHRVTQIMLNKWRQAEVRIFGSVITGLFLPTSDIDVVVLGQWHQTPIFTLEEELKRAKIAVEGSINPLDKTAVPVIKFTDLATEVKVDICFNRTSGGHQCGGHLGFYTAVPDSPKIGPRSQAIPDAAKFARSLLRWKSALTHSSSSW